MVNNKKINFNIPYLTGNEQAALQDVLLRLELQGNGYYTHECHAWFRKKLQPAATFFTTSCTSGLEMACLVANLGQGDEVLVPDYTFVSSAQAIALRGGTPVLCDIRHDTLNLDENRLEEALTSKTRAIMPVHYGGVSANMSVISDFAKKHDLIVIEDAAQAIGCEYQGRAVGTFGDFSVFSFHTTKNIHCGEGGMVVVNNEKYANDSSMAWDKGTNRQDFYEGNVERYQWMRLGSSYLASEFNAAMLSVQLAAEEKINDMRRAIWQNYYDAFLPFTETGLVTFQHVPDDCVHNGHLFCLILPDKSCRSALLSFLSDVNIFATFHYTPLHESKAGKKYCRQAMDLSVSSSIAERSLRLPIYPDLSADQQQRVIERIQEFLGKL